MSEAGEYSSYFAVEASVPQGSIYSVYTAASQPMTPPSWLHFKHVYPLISMILMSTAPSVAQGPAPRSTGWRVHYLLSVFLGNSE